jgi:menaquinone-specific isochorismate synthase
MAVRQLPHQQQTDRNTPLLEQLSSIGPFSGPRQLIQQLDEDQALPWLASKSLYPKAYWQRRDEQLELAAAGAVRLFAQATDASDCLAQFHNIPLTLLGALPFACNGESEHNQALFFLPRLLWQREGKRVTLTLNLWVDKDNDFNSEVKAARAALSNSQPIKFAERLPKVLAVNNAPEQGQWHSLVKKALSRQPALSKVVLARRQQLTTSKPCDPWLLLSRWHAENQHSSPFALQLNEQSIFIGCTPERLFQRIGRRLVSEAVAGTDVRPNDPLHARLIAKALLGDGKNRRENRMVLDDILSRLGPLCDALSYDDHTQVLKLNRLQHLKRNIHGHLREQIVDSDLLLRLHPTPAVGGTPRQMAMKFIAANEPFKRGWYAGAIGYMSQEHSEFCVAIRSAQLEGCQLTLFSGAGIVDGSDAAKEWQELDNKLATVRSLMGLT